MPPVKKTTAASKAKAGAKPKPKAAPRRKVVVVSEDEDSPSQITKNVTSLLRNLSEIAYNNQSMLANIVTNQAILLRTIESQNLNQARMTELIASTLKIVETDSRRSQGTMATLETTVKDTLGTTGERFGEIGSQTGRVLEALHELARSSKENAEALQKMVARFG